MPLAVMTGSSHLPCARWMTRRPDHVPAPVAVSPLNHRLLILRWLEERSLVNVAILLNISEKQVTSRQRRLFRQLRVALTVYRGEPFGPEAASNPGTP